MCVDINTRSIASVRPPFVSHEHTEALTSGQESRGHHLETIIALQDILLDKIVFFGLMEIQHVKKKLFQRNKYLIRVTTRV